MYNLPAFLTFLSVASFVSGAPTTSMTLARRHARLAKLKDSSSDAQAARLFVKRKADTEMFHFPKDLYGGFFDGLDSWEELPAVQQVFRQLESTMTIAPSTGTRNASPTPTEGIISLDHPPYMGPGIELAPASSSATGTIPTPPNRNISGSTHPYAPGLHKLIAVITVVAAIGLVMLFCLLINERHSFWCCCSSKERKAEGKRIKQRAAMTERERDMRAWRMRYLSSSASPRSRYLTPSSPAPSDLSSECGSESSMLPRTPSPGLQGDHDESELPKSKWSMTISDYGGASPRTSGSSGQEPLYPPILVSPPQVYSPVQRAASGYPWYGHVRNQSAPVTPSIASSASDVNVEGRSRSSSTSSGRVPRVHWLR